jgi:hypothetical protein
MNLYWEENERSGDEEKPANKIDGTVDMKTLTEALMGNTQTAYVSSFKSPPPVVGGYDITGGDGKQNSISFMMVKKPNWFHRTCTRFFLGWRWHDKK